MNIHKSRVLILGATGMLGSTLFRIFNADPKIDCFGTIRDAGGLKYFSPDQQKSIIPNIHFEGENGLLSAFASARPEIVINCIGIIKQLPLAKNHLESLAINSLLPHRIAKYWSMTGAKLVHFSTDCVFSGRKGNYTEKDFPDANDLYGRTKFLGEVDYENAITLRTSIIGHELSSSKSLIDWFLNQSVIIKGYRKAIFSGLPTTEIARVVKSYVLSNQDLHGLYHLSVDPISKHELLRLVAQVYCKEIEIVPDDEVVIDRSLNSDRFRIDTGYEARPWIDMIKDMHRDFKSNQDQ